MKTASSRVAGAPISWGVCEVPGWGHQLPVERVLTEMRAAGLAATEFGPAGFLPDDAAARADLLARHGLQAVGGFVPVVLHESPQWTGPDPMAEVTRALAGFRGDNAGDAGLLVLAAATGNDGYGARPALDGTGWRQLLSTLDVLAAVAAEQGVTAVLHPHIGTMVENGDEVARVLAGSRIGLCLDTGHLMAGGVDPAALAREAPERVAHVHLKDVSAVKAARFRTGEVSYHDAVRDGLYRPLGDGDVDIAAVVGALEGVGYGGWYVLEQDVVLDAAPTPGDGPVADVLACREYLESVLT